VTESYDWALPMPIAHHFTNIEDPKFVRSDYWYRGYDIRIYPDYADVTRNPNVANPEWIRLKKKDDTLLNEAKAYIDFQYDYQAEVDRCTEANKDNYEESFGGTESDE
jgi:hypothetical protein